MTTTLFHLLTFTDAEAQITWLNQVGFTEKLVVRDDGGAVVHGQFAWGSDGGIMFGSDQRAVGADGGCINQSVGTAKCYCVVPDDAAVDEVFAKAVAAGARPVNEPVERDYGGRECTVDDPEGNQWSFGSYPGA